MNTMCKSILTNILLYTACVKGFRFYGFGNGYRYLTKQMAIDADTFNSTSVKTKWIEQPLDHFDSKENRTWKMRYFENLEFWKPNGPIYLLIGGEGNISQYLLTSGIMYELAKETNGAIFGSEHRYYGQSIPLKNTVTKNLRYLSSRQALADLAYLLKTIRSSPMFEKFTSSKVVLVGCSYAGNLAVWMKILYPNVIDAAIASSAPVFAKKNFYEYLETVSYNYKHYGQEGCHVKIRETFRRYQRMFKREEGIKLLKSKENICAFTDMTKTENRQIFFLDKVTEFMNETNFGSPAKIHEHCSKIMSSTGIVSLNFTNDDEPILWRKESNCYDYDFYNMIDKYKKRDWYKSWYYQSCTEFGYFQSTDSDNQPFTKNIPVNIYYKMCAGMFGPDFNEESIDRSIEETNKLYGGLRPNVKQVVFVNGDMDPWSKLGVLKNISNETPAIHIAGSSHCRDLYPNREGDPQELVEARSSIKNYIKKWIGYGEYYDG